MTTEHDYLFQELCKERLVVVEFLYDKKQVPRICSVFTIEGDPRKPRYNEYDVEWSNRSGEYFVNWAGC